MTVPSMEVANIALHNAAAIVELHDALLGKVIKTRADFELGMTKQPDDFNALQVSNALNNIQHDIADFENRVVLLTNVENFEEFRSMAISGQHKLAVLAQFKERIDTQEFYLSIYNHSGIGPQNLPDGETYEADVEGEKLANIKAQYITAIRIFVECVADINVEDPSPIVLASTDIIDA